MKKYESVIIINAKLEEKEIKDTIEKYKNMMQEFSGKEPKVDGYRCTVCGREIRTGEGKKK